MKDSLPIQFGTHKTYLYLHFKSGRDMDMNNFLSSKFLVKFSIFFTTRMTLSVSTGRCMLTLMLIGINVNCKSLSQFNLSFRLKVYTVISYDVFGYNLYRFSLLHAMSEDYLVCVLSSWDGDVHCLELFRPVHCRVWFNWLLGSVYYLTSH